MIAEEDIRSAIKRDEANLLARFASLRVRVGKDSTSDPAVWVTLVLDDEVLDRIWSKRDELRDQVADIVRKAAGGDYWPYVSFQATSEQLPERKAAP